MTEYALIAKAHSNHLFMSEHDWSCLIKISDVLTLCRSNFKILSGALHCHPCITYYALCVVKSHMHTLSHWGHGVHAESLLHNHVQIRHVLSCIIHGLVLYRTYNINNDSSHFGRKKRCVKYTKYTTSCVAH